MGGSRTATPVEAKPVYSDNPGLTPAITSYVAQSKQRAMREGRNVANGQTNGKEVG